MTESEEELKSLLMKVKEESQKVGLKLKIQKTKIMASGPITSWETDEETVETVSDFILGGPKITAMVTVAMELKEAYSLVGKVMSLLFNMLSSLDIAFLRRSKCLLISWLQSSSAMILEPKKRKPVTVSIISPSICHEVMGPDAIILVF